MDSEYNLIETRDSRVNTGFILAWALPGTCHVTWSKSRGPSFILFKEGMETVALPISEGYEKGPLIGGWEDVL